MDATHETPEVDEIDVDIEKTEEVEDLGYDLVEEDDMTPEDSLAIILSARPVHQTAKVGIKARQGMPRIVVTLKSLTDRQFKALRQQAQKPAENPKDRKAGKTELDDSLFLRLVVAAAIESPKIASKEVLDALGVKRPDQVVDTLFLPGRITALAERVMELSGFDEDGVLDVGEGS